MPKADVFDANPGMDPPDTPGPEIEYKVIAEGDSWFAFGGFPIDNLLRRDIWNSRASPVSTISARSVMRSARIWPTP